MIQTLLSVPPALKRFLARTGGRNAAGARPAVTFFGSDPEGKRLGSGGGTAALLHAAWQGAPARGKPAFAEWIASRQSLVLHAGGESRRLPAYAALGKALLPIPALGGSAPRRFDQTLADFQLPVYTQVLREAGTKAAVLVASGDVWLELDPLQIPRLSTDIAGIGMRVTPEIARHFGVFFVAKTSAGRGTRENPISFFRQKPSPEEIYRHLSHYDFFVDTGLWLLSAAAVQLLCRRCGWDERRQRFLTVDGHPTHLDLYTEIGAALGTQTRPPAALQRIGWRRLTSSVIPLDDARFFHLGSSRQLFESFAQLARTPNQETAAFSVASAPPGQTRTSRLPVWLDGVGAPNGLRLDGLNLVTGLPAGSKPVRLRQEHCLDIAPIGRHHFVVRPYALDDRLRGTPGQGGTICGRDAAAWLATRGFKSGAPLARAQPRPKPHVGRQRPGKADVFEIPIYPIVAAHAIDQPLLDWFFADHPDPAASARWRALPRLAAVDIPGAVNFTRYFGQRRANEAASLQAEFVACRDHGDTRVFAQDFDAVAEFCRTDAPALRAWLLRHHRDMLARLVRPEHRSRLLAAVAALQPRAARERFARQAYLSLQSAIAGSAQLAPSRPRLALKEDQIVWSRSPVRLDLAGGWTDTPPYCFEYGGAVLNLAVLLNGQPPIQVFVRPLAEPLVSLRSIDLGSSEIITTYAGLSGFRDPRSGFSLPKAALALAGFHPEFAVGKNHSTLRSRLSAFGGGLEISLLSAVPKGSGLGTSSILGATLLGALNRACGLGWDEVSLYNRVLGMEQLLTTGGGWQDQAGALFRGVKLIQTTPGPAQTPSVRFLPGHLFDASRANHTLLLYYTGITRLAKGILKEIVSDMFLGKFATLQTLNLIRANALELFETLQHGDVPSLPRCIGRSWDLNKRLDRGTSTPEIEKILLRCGPDLTAAKLLGAGGGGYMFLCAPTAEAGARIRERLEKDPPNRRARFIDFQLAERGLEVTVS